MSHFCFLLLVFEICENGGTCVNTPGSFRFVTHTCTSLISLILIFKLEGLFVLYPVFAGATAHRATKVRAVTSTSTSARRTRVRMRAPASTDPGSSCAHAC